MHEKYICFAKWITIVSCIAGSSWGADKPNVLLVMVDDMGFSDIGSYGGEIDTPHLDNLAENGLRFTDFYNTARCWPTRTSLMTGYHLEQITGGGARAKKEQQAAVTERLTGLPKILKQEGYRSYHTGKWHVNVLSKVIKDAGFDYSMAFHTGHNHFRPRNRTKDDQPYPNEDVHVTDAITDHMIAYLQDHQKNHADQPFFSYLAYYAPHWPLHARQETIAKYDGVYDAGWDELSKKRLARLKEMGFPKNWTIPSLEPKIKASGIQETGDGRAIFGPNEIYRAYNWNDLSKEVQDFQAVKMQVHAAMIDEMDQAFGRVIQQLKDMGEFENTLILFLSDNGASAEIYGSYKKKSNDDLHDEDAEMGSADTYLCLGPGFAALANTPFRRYKSWVHEGGVATPLIAHWPNGIDQSLQGKLNLREGHVVDLVSTILDVAGIDNPALQPGAPTLPGKSFAEAFKAKTFDKPFGNPIFFHHRGNRALRVGDWKVVSAKIDKNQWELYNLKEDRAEMNNLANSNPEKLKELVDEWNRLYKQYRQDAEL